ncbi:MAG: MarR family transcriptional regulator [Candidatus Marinimicrobia bacterium]|nr:MarR family transcriptional regulator [Candidatus Neomarinimicrobiota bacterium]
MKNHQSISRFLSCLYRHTQMYFDRQLGQYELSYGVLSFLMVLFHHDGIHQEEISRKLSIDKATTTRAIHKLIESGYVRRETDPADRRAYFIYLTDKGLALKPELTQLSRDWSAQLSSGFTSEEKEQIFQLLEKMSYNSAMLKSIHNQHTSD